MFMMGSPEESRRRTIRGRLLLGFGSTIALLFGAGAVGTAMLARGQDALRDHRSAHPLARVFPLLDDVLGQAARDCDAVMAVSDAAGQLLWVCGTPGVLRRAESIGFVEGSNWDERLVGTNAPGVALHVDAPIAINGTEHFNRLVHPWSCAAAPTTISMSR